MPRNSSGTYSLYTPGNPVVTSTVISSTWANNTLADLASAMTDSLSRSGDGGMLAPLELTDGAIGAPGMTWGTESTAGWYRASAGNFRFSVGGADKLGLAAQGALFADGAAGAPSVSFLSDTNTGLYSAGADAVNLALGGVSQVAFSTASTVFAQVIRGAAGAVGAPSYSFSADTDSGVYRIGADNIGVAVNATKILDIASTGLSVTGAFSATTTIGGTVISGSTGFLAGNGAVGTPSFSFTSDPDTGFYRFGTNQLGITTAGTQAGIVDEIGNFRWRDGTNSLPAYSFFNDSDTGIYRIGANSLGFAEGGTGYQIGYRSIPRSTTATTFAIGDVGKCVAVSAAINIPASVFAAGDAISVYNDSGSSVNITISAGTLRLAGSTSTGTRALAARGVATLWFNVGGATPEVIASGSGLS